MNEQEWKNFNKDLLDTLYTSLPNSNETLDVNSYADKITSAYKKVVDKYMPLKKKKMKKKKYNFDKPWFTQGIKLSRIEKFRLLDIAKESNDPGDYIKYKKYLNKYTYLKSDARENYYH